jgi:hypothetical protein
MFVLEHEDRDLFDRIQEQNLNRQYELLTNCIEIGLKKGPTSFDKYMLWALNHVAVANISQFGGRFADLEKSRFTSEITSHLTSNKYQIGWIDLFLQSKKIGISGRRPNSLHMDCGVSIGYTRLLRETGALRGQPAIIFCAFDREHSCQDAR